MRTTHGPVVIRRRLGYVLKQLRGQQGLLLDAVARQLEISASKLSRIETGQVEPKIRDVRDLLDIYDAGSEVSEQVMEWAAQAKTPGWWQPFSVDIAADLDLYISLEAEARSVNIFSTPVSGLLQTHEYAQSIITGAVPDATPDEIRILVSVRTGRQEVISATRSDALPLELHAVLDESALHRSLLGTDAMIDQISHLIEQSQLPNITLQILPFDAGFTQASSTFAIFEPVAKTDWTVVNVESAGMDAYVDTPAEVARYRSMWQSVLSSALSPDETRDLMSRRIISMTREGTK